MYYHSWNWLFKTIIQNKNGSQLLIYPSSVCISVSNFCYCLNVHFLHHLFTFSSLLKHKSQQSCSFLEGCSLVLGLNCRKLRSMKQYCGKCSFLTFSLETTIAPPQHGTPTQVFPLVLPNLTFSLCRVAWTD